LSFGIREKRKKKCQTSGRAGVSKKTGAGVVRRKKLGRTKGG